MEDKEKLIEKLNQLYGKVYKYNFNLMNQSENLQHEETFDKIFDFYITSHSIGYLKGLILNDIYNAGFFLHARCIVEGLALKKMNELNMISDLQKKLLKKQLFLIEYNNYKNFMDIADEIFLPEKLKYDYDEAVKYFKQALSSSYTNNKINKIIDSQIPFLCNDRLSFYQIIEQYLGKEFSIMYGVYSWYIHPTNNVITTKVIDDIAWILLPILYEKYNHLPDGISFDQDFKQTSSIFGVKLHDILSNLINILNTSVNALETGIETNYIIYTFYKIINTISTIDIEKSMGLTETIKCKWKVVLEHFATLDYINNNFKENKNRFALLDIYSSLQMTKNLKVDINFNDAYNCYCEIYPNNTCPQETFERIFLKPLGYLIDEKGETPTITNVVKSFCFNFGLDERGKLTLGKAMILDYAESQMLSHANGYMWYANGGAWKDVNNIFKAIFELSIFVLQKIENYYRNLNVSNKTKKYKPIINLFRHSIKKIQEMKPVLGYLLILPTVDKPTD